MAAEQAPQAPEHDNTPAARRRREEALAHGLRQNQNVYHHSHVDVDDDLPPPITAQPWL